METRNTMTRKDEILAMDCEEMQGNCERLWGEKDRMSKLVRMTRTSRMTSHIELLLGDWSLDGLIGVTWEFMPETEEESETVTLEEANEVAENVVRYENYLIGYYDDKMDIIESLRLGEVTSQMETRLHRYDHCLEQLCYCYARLSKRLGLW
jgi:hypothetical protein